MLRTGLHVSTVGEDVGLGNSMDVIVVGFLESPAHRALLLGHFTWVGVGVSHLNGSLLVFVDLAR